MANTESIFKAVSDRTRQRLLCALAGGELSVNELVEVLDQPQSTISRHLKILKDAGLLVDRRNGTTVMYAAIMHSPPLPEGSSTITTVNLEDEDGVRGNPNLRTRLMDWVRSEGLDDSVKDRLRRVRGRRVKDTEYFDAIGDLWDKLRIDAFGGIFHFEALTALLPADWVVADVGCGTGYLLGPLAARFKRVIAIDPVPAMLETARNRPELKQSGNIDFRQGSLSRLPLANSEADLAVACLVLHHVGNPVEALKDIKRSLAYDGRLLIIEQYTHDNDAFRDRMGDSRWGFDPELLGQCVGQAGFSGIRVMPLSTAKPARRDIGRIPGLFVLTAIKSKAADTATEIPKKVRKIPEARGLKPARAAESKRSARDKSGVDAGIETEMDVHLL